MKLAIDYGLSNIDFFLKGDDEHFWTEESINFSHQRSFEEYVSQLAAKHLIQHIGISGGKSKIFSFNDTNKSYFSEIDAFSYGAKKIYGFDSGIVVSCGTGTACAYVDNQQAIHLGGIANGGGLIKAFHKHFLHCGDVKKIQQMSIEGNSANIDLNISEAVGELGALNPKLTAVNFGKLEHKDGYISKDISQSILKMVGESIGTTASLYAHMMGVKNVYLTGRTAQFTEVKKGIDSILAAGQLDCHLAAETEKANVIGIMELLKKTLT